MIQELKKDARLEARRERKRSEQVSAFRVKVFEYVGESEEKAREVLEFLPPGFVRFCVREKLQQLTGETE